MTDPENRGLKGEGVVGNADDLQRVAVTDPENRGLKDIMRNTFQFEIRELQ